MVFLAHIPHITYVHWVDANHYMVSLVLFINTFNVSLFDYSAWSLLPPNAGTILVLTNEPVP